MTCYVAVSPTDSARTVVGLLHTRSVRMSVEASDFKAALARFPSGVTVITVVDTDAPPGEQDHGMTASAFCSLSLDPPLILVCVKKGNATHDKLTRAGGFGVNILAADQVSVSNRFAGWWKEGVSKWADLDLSRGAESGAPLIGGALARLDCQKFKALDGGDHTIFIGEVHGAEVSAADGADPEPLLYFFGGYRTIGAAP